MRRPSLTFALALTWLFLATRHPAGADMVLAPGEALTPGHIADLIGAALAERGIGGRLSVEVGAPAAPLPNRAAAPMRVTVAELRYQVSTGRYDARLSASLPTGQSSTIASAGRVEELVEVPVLNRPLGRGETIRAQDIDRRSLVAATLGPGTLQEVEALVGMQAARPLSAGKALRAHDLVAPMLVRRGEAVTMVFARGGLEVTGTGVALDSGAEGDTVRVQNAAGGEARHAVVMGPRRVLVGRAG